MGDHLCYVRILGGCEKENAREISVLKGSRTHDLCDTGSSCKKPSSLKLGKNKHIPLKI